MRFQIPALLFVACLLAGPAAAERSRRLTWDEFAVRAGAGCSIRMVLPDGTRIEGRPVRFDPEAMELRVSKTSNRGVHPKGSLTVPRQTVSVVEIRTRRWKRRLIGTLVPIGAGAGILAGALSRANEGALYELVAVGGGVIGVGGPAGHFIGRASDRRFEQFVIVPE